MEAIKISLDDYILSGGGFNGESYDHKTDSSIMLKLYFPGKVQQPLDEMKLARKVYDLGIPTPNPGDYVVTEDGRYGIRFQRIPNKVSYSRASGDHPENVQQYAEEFAQMCLQLHSTHIDTTQFENIKDRYYRVLAANPSLQQKRRKNSANSSPVSPIPTRPSTVTCSFPTPSSRATNAISSTSVISAMDILISMSRCSIFAVFWMVRNT